MQPRPALPLASCSLGDLERAGRARPGHPGALDRAGTHRNLSRLRLGCRAACCGLGRPPFWALHRSAEGAGRSLPRRCEGACPATYMHEALPILDTWRSVQCGSGRLACEAEPLCNKGLAVNDSRLRGARRQHRLLRERGARLDQTVHTFGWSVAGLQQGRTLLLQQKLHLAQEPSTCTRYMQRQQQRTTWALQCNTKHASLVHDKPPHACHTAPYPVNR